MSASLLREAAALMREEWFVREADPFCSCEDSDAWFDRSICPEPCDSMHNICVDCGRIQGICEVAFMARDHGNRLALSWLAVADWLDAEAVAVESLAQAGIDRQFDEAWVARETASRHGHAFTVARTYLGRES